MDHFKEDDELYLMQMIVLAMAYEYYYWYRIKDVEFVENSHVKCQK